MAEIVAAEPWDDMSVASERPSDADFLLAYEPPPPESSLDSPPELSVPFAPPEIEAAANAEVLAAPDERLAPIEESLPIELDEVPVATGAAPQAAEPPTPERAPLPALADAFAALLAAEQGGLSSERSGLWPSTLAPSAEAREELVEEVVRRVLDRLSDTVVREAVADVASKVAERLILEEIERIRPQSWTRSSDAIVAAADAARSCAPPVSKAALEGLGGQMAPSVEESAVPTSSRAANRRMCFHRQPPPIVSGSLHVGQSFLYAYRLDRAFPANARPFSTSWLDDNGLPTERRVQNYYGVRCTYRCRISRIPAAAAAACCRCRYRVPIIELCDRSTKEDEQAFERLWKTLGLSID